MHDPIPRHLWALLNKLSACFKGMKLEVRREMRETCTEKRYHRRLEEVIWEWI